MARPSFKPTKAMRQQVAIAKASGMADKKIALALGISRGTLLKHFAQELDGGAAKRQLEVRTALHRAAMKGNVAAQKALISMAERADADKAFDDAIKPPAADPVGKKEAATAAAKGAELATEWHGVLPN